jgi:fibrillarin-like rRNA methylase
MEDDNLGYAVREPSSADERMCTSTMIGAIIYAAREIDLDTVRDLIGEAERQDTVMPILDPTRYRREMKAIHGAADVLRAFVTFRTAIDKATP